MDLTLNIYGYLTPAHPIPTTLQEFRAAFVDSRNDSTHREIVFESYLMYSHDLMELVGPFVQWVDGSFVTGKLRPRDIDVVTFVPDATLEQFQEELVPFKSRHSSVYPAVDPYFIKTYPEGHPKFSHYLSDRAYWLDLFSKTRMDRRKRRFDKGFVELAFTRSR